MNIYHFHHKTGEFLSKSTVDMSPSESGVPLVPRNATTHAPPLANEGNVAVWTGEGWIICVDYRGTKAWEKATGAEAIINAPGTVPEHLTTQGPPTPFQSWDEETKSWTEAPKKLPPLLEAM